MVKKSSGPCLACGAYDGDHDPGCVLDPADRPHAYKPRKVTAAALAESSGIRFDFEKGRRGFGPGSKPCDVCGGSATLPIHDVGTGKAYVARFPSLYAI